MGGAFLALASLQFGGVVVLGKTATVEALPVPSMLTVRFGVAATILAVVLALSGRGLRPERGEGRWLVLLGAVGYATEAALFFLALERGTAATVTLLFFTYPVLVAVISSALGLGRPGVLVGAALVAAVAGAGLVVGSSGGLDITATGIAFALGSALMFSGYLLIADRAIRRTPPLVSALWTSAFSALSLAGFSVLGGGRVPQGAALVMVMAMGLLTAGAFTFMFLGLRRLGAVRTAIVASLEPVAAATLAAMFLGEVLRGGVLLGGALILAGAIAATVAGGIPEPEPAVP